MKKIKIIIAIVTSSFCAQSQAQSTGYVLYNLNGTFTLPNGNTVTLGSTDTSSLSDRINLKLSTATAAATYQVQGNYATGGGTATGTNTGDNATNTQYSGLAASKANIADPTFTGAVRTSGSIGYSAGAGGTVTQATSKTTAVTLNKIAGQITMNGAALAAAAEVAFTLNNSTIAATDVVIVNVQSVGTAGAYLVGVGAVANGSCSITVSNASAGSLSQAIVLNFCVIKSVNN